MIGSTESGLTFCCRLLTMDAEVIVMKKMLSLLLAFLLLFGCFGCGAQPQNTETPRETPQETPRETPQETKRTASQAAIDALQGKSIIFVGNSYTFFGQAVMMKDVNDSTQVLRANDTGYFYQLCKAMGMEVTVTNWTFGGHDLTDSLGNSCTHPHAPGTDHLGCLRDRKFDYVALQLYKEDEYAGDMNAHLQPFMDLFREENPDVKFLLLVPHMAYDRGYAWIDGLETMDRSDITVCNWGKLLDDIVKRKVEVPGATQSYARPTFVVSIDESDGHHQNLLVGYLTAAMVYCAITGESAEGLPYDFVDDRTIDWRFNLEAYKAEKYVYEPYTNFVEVYRSEADMLGLQQLLDQYLETENP